MIREFSADEFWFLVLAARWTIVLAAAAFLGGGVAGVAVAVLRVLPNRGVRLAASVYIKVLQGIPLLILLFLVYFGSSLVGLRTDSWTAAVIGMTLYASAFLGEIWRGCIEAVPKTQWEASDCLGLNRAQQYAYVILPQALRIAVPPTVGFMVQIVKNTSLASVIGFVELSRAGQIVNNSTFEPFVIFSAVALIYFVLCYPLSVAARTLERKAHAGR